MQLPVDENARNALARDEEAMAPYEASLNDAVEQVLAGADPQKILQQLLVNAPPGVKAALTRRFNFVLEERKPKAVSQPKPRIAQPEPEQTPAAPARGEPKKPRFGLAQAALLMAAGTFDRIRALLTKRPDLQARIAEIGQRMTGSGVTADMVLLERLETIRTQAVQRAQVQAQQREQGRG